MNRWSLPWVTVLMLSSCATTEAPPVLVEPAAPALRPIAASVLEEMRAAREGVAARDRDLHLERAEAGLEKLNEYYLPLLDAKDRAYQAYRLFYLDRGLVKGELDEIETLLTSVIAARGGGVETSMAPAFELMTEARAAIEAGSPSAPKHLHDLARRLSYMLLKGELIL